jgi:ferredoxin/flavodoxin---NADP+ reductase
MTDNRFITELKAHRITSCNEISPDVFVISFKRDFSFVAGQVVKLALDKKTEPRIYSLCSGTNDEDASILFNVKKTGTLTPRLARLMPGDEILVSSPYGSFSCNHDPAWWIATGTGIAPYYSMLRSDLGGNKKLIHGVRYLNQFYFEKELKQKLGENYIQCCSHESSQHVFTGRITHYLSTLNGFPDINYYLCGNALMVVEVRDLLISAGISYKRINSEIYF